MANEGEQQRRASSSDGESLMPADNDVPPRSPPPTPVPPTSRRPSSEGSNRSSIFHFLTKSRAASVEAVETSAEAQDDAKVSQRQEATKPQEGGAPRPEAEARPNTRVAWLKEKFVGISTRLAKREVGESVNRLDSAAAGDNSIQVQSSSGRRRYSDGADFPRRSTLDKSHLESQPHSITAKNFNTANPKLHELSGISERTELGLSPPQEYTTSSGEEFDDQTIAGIMDSAEGSCSYLESTYQEHDDATFSDSDESGIRDIHRSASDQGSGSERRRPVLSRLGSTATKPTESSLAKEREKHLLKSSRKNSSTAMKEPPREKGRAQRLPSQPREKTRFRRPQRSDNDIDLSDSDRDAVPLSGAFTPGRGINSLDSDIQSEDRDQRFANTNTWLEGVQHADFDPESQKGPVDEKTVEYKLPENGDEPAISESGAQMVAHDASSNIEELEGLKVSDERDRYAPINDIRPITKEEHAKVWREDGLLYAKLGEVQQERDDALEKLAECQKHGLDQKNTFETKLSKILRERDAAKRQLRSEIDERAKKVYDFDLERKNKDLQIDLDSARDENVKFDMKLNKQQWLAQEWEKEYNDSQIILEERIEGYAKADLDQKEEILGYIEAYQNKTKDREHWHVAGLQRRIGNLEQDLKTMNDMLSVLKSENSKLDDENKELRLTKERDDHEIEEIQRQYFMLGRAAHTPSIPRPEPAKPASAGSDQAGASPPPTAEGEAEVNVKVKADVKAEAESEVKAKAGSVNSSESVAWLLPERAPNTGAFIPRCNRPESVAKRDAKLEETRKNQKKQRDSERLLLDTLETVRAWKLEERYPPKHPDWDALVKDSTWKRWDGRQWLHVKREEKDELAVENIRTLENLGLLGSL
ncbi:hypothetical protein CC86DRAFT_414412 [Ophiobolus disseminans]|uniref:Uncharacterized protein n=1 Tax=Ophiobolus disseminans TaxID=1469910 RepID=A0A6A7AI84_9PLEO|nr:hypothetical protein CC86DRAFT_414412 [Ophiobolus disseminans]